MEDHFYLKESPKDKFVIIQINTWQTFFSMVNKVGLSNSRKKKTVLAADETI